MTTELSKSPMQKLKHSWKANRNLLPKKNRKLLPKKIPSKQRRIKKTERKKMKRIKVDNFQKLPFVGTPFVHIFWEGHYNLTKSPHFIWNYLIESKKVWEISAYFCGLLRMYNLYRIIWQIFSTQHSVTPGLEFWGQGSTGSRFLLKISSRKINIWFDFHWLPNG